MSFRTRKTKKTTRKGTLQSSYEVAILKVYKYKGRDIVIRRIGPYMFEYLFVFKGKPYANHYLLSDVERRKIDKKYTGGAAFLTALAAEKHIKLLRRTKTFWYRIWYNLIAKYFDRAKVENQPNQNDDSDNTRQAG